MSDKQLVWAKRIEAWRSSGQSRAGFRRAHGLTYAQFVFWQRVSRAAVALEPVVVEATLARPPP